MPTPLVIVPSTLIAGTGATFGSGTSGGTITAGMPVYIDASDSNKVKACDAYASDAAAAAVGISLHASLAGQPIKYITGGNLAFGVLLTTGTIYVVGGATAGDINPAVDLATNYRTTILGVATSTSIMALNIVASGATV